jgi:hypothetical protein
MRVHTGFGRKSGLIDIGAGLNIPALHAATVHCYYAVGIEIEVTYWKPRASCSSIAKSTRGYAEPSGGSYQRRRVSCEACGVCHPWFAFDLAFNPSLYLEMIDWVKSF